MSICFEDAFSMSQEHPQVHERERQWKHSREKKKIKIIKVHYIRRHKSTQGQSRGQVFKAWMVQTPLLPASEIG